MITVGTMRIRVFTSDPTGVEPGNSGDLGIYLGNLYIFQEGFDWILLT